MLTRRLTTFASFKGAEAATYGHELVFLEPRLTAETAPLAAGFEAICAFVNDRLDAMAIATLAQVGVRLIALRSAGFNHVDLVAARTASAVALASYGMTVVRVECLFPLCGSRTYCGADFESQPEDSSCLQPRFGNFALDGLLGFDLHGRTAGIVGTGKIGALVAGILRGFGCRLLAYDVATNPDCLAMGVEYVPLPDLFAVSDIITLHCPKSPQLTISLIKHLWS